MYYSGVSFREEVRHTLVGFAHEIVLHQDVALPSVERGRQSFF